MPEIMRKVRTLKEVRGTPRSALVSQWLSRNAGGLLSSHFSSWVFHYLKVAFSRRRPFPPRDNYSGIIEVADECTIGLAGDWGTGTASADRVAECIRSHGPDVTIHLGDVYYSGTEDEFRDYFIGRWPNGSKRTFTLNANHEMYSGGGGYFDVALPALNQAASYFCLENKHWRILALDTGYYSAVLPLLEWLFVRHIRLHPEMLDWLRNVIFHDPNDKRPVILLTHHQWFSAYQQEYHRIGADLAPYLDRVVVWLWAHEHRFAGYGPFSLGGSPPVRARCIGHGGIPIELGSKPKRSRSSRNLVFTDERENPEESKALGEPIGYCGYAVLELAGPAAEIRYYDETYDEKTNNSALLTERWTTDKKGKASVSSGLKLHQSIDRLVE